jgi:hypothetical protein
MEVLSSLSVVVVSCAKMTDGVGIMFEQMQLGEVEVFTVACTKIDENIFVGVEFIQMHLRDTQVLPQYGFGTKQFQGNLGGYKWHESLQQVQLVHQQCILGVACIFHDVQDQKLG